MPVTYPDNQENAVRSALNSGTINSLSAEKQCSPNPLIFLYVVAHDCFENNCSSRFVRPNSIELSRTMGGPYKLTCEPACSAVRHFRKDEMRPSVSPTTFLPAAMQQWVNTNRLRAIGSLEGHREAETSADYRLILIAVGTIWFFRSLGLGGGSESGVGCCVVALVIYAAERSR
jgi:hypothetical protein